MRPSFRGALVLLGALSGIAGCHRQLDAHAETSEVPPGEVWLTDAQVTEAKVKIEPLDEQDVDDVILTSGKVTFDDALVSHVFSPVSGRITRIDAGLGQRVKKGDVLAVLESPDVGIASSDLHKAQADLVAAQHDLDRQKDMLAAHATSQRDYEQSEDAFRKAKAEVERAQQKTRLFRATGGEVTQAYSLRAEIDGEVLARNVSPGIEVQGQYGGGSAPELFTVGEIHRVWVMADVYEMDSPRVKVGSKVTMKLFAYPGRVFHGTINWVSGVLDPQTRTAKVRIVQDNSDFALKPEMYATLYIHVEEKKELAVPRAAIVRLGEQTAVYVEKGRAPDGREMFTKTPVKVDEAEGGKWVPILGGVDKGARVVV
ncbi:MAG TPA: efflux RND transporter periplasmic adaptor subunit, partial [Polyangiaceae bacterium]|nr:efflux RND transporter periplasmic adaptor subunit [Polyangiaceae bacterium]